MQSPHSPLIRRFGVGVSAVGIVAAMLAATLGVYPDTPTASSVITSDRPAVALAAITAEPVSLGVTDATAYRMPVEALDDTLDELERLGVTALRVGAPWQHLSATDSREAAWERLDAIVDGANRRQMTVTIVAAVRSMWAGVSPDEEAAPDHFAEFAKELATRYRGKVARYEIWSDLGLPASADEAATIATMLKEALGAIRLEDPRVAVSMHNTSAPALGASAQVTADIAGAAEGGAESVTVAQTTPTALPVETSAVPTHSVVPTAEAATTETATAANPGAATETSSPTSSAGSTAPSVTTSKSTSSKSSSSPTAAAGNDGTGGAPDTALPDIPTADPPAGHAGEVPEVSAAEE